MISEKYHIAKTLALLYCTWILCISLALSPPHPTSCSLTTTPHKPRAEPCHPSPPNAPTAPTKSGITTLPSHAPRPRRYLTTVHLSPRHVPLKQPPPPKKQCTRSIPTPNKPKTKPPLKTPPPPTKRRQHHSRLLLLPKLLIRTPPSLRSSTLHHRHRSMWPRHPLRMMMKPASPSPDPDA